MAYITMNESLKATGLMRHVLTLGEDFRDRLGRLRNTMVEMLNGQDSALAASYTVHVTAFGFASTADALAAFNLIDTLYQGITSNAAQSGVSDKFTQAFNRLR